MSDTFDNYLITDALIYRRATGSADAYNQPDETFNLLATVPGRFSTKGSGREFKVDKEIAVIIGTVFIRPYAGLTHRDRVQVNGIMYNIIVIDDPSNLGHHYELSVELVEP